MGGLLLEKIGKVNCAQPQHDLCSPPTKTSHILQLSCPRGKKNKRNDERKKRFRLFDFALAITTAPEGNRRRPPKPAENPAGVSDCSRLLKTATTSTTVSEPAAFAESSCFIHPVLCPGVTRSWLAGRSGSCSG